jgi:hypothetical protein
MSSSLQQLLTKWKTNLPNHQPILQEEPTLKTFQKVQATFIPEVGSVNYGIQECTTENGLLVGVKDSTDNAALYVQFKSPMEMVWGLPGGNLVGRLAVVTLADGSMLEYYTLKQYSIIQTSDIVHFTAIKNSGTNVYQVTLKGTDKDGQGSEKIFTLALDTRVVCCKQGKCNAFQPALVLIPTGMDNPRFVKGGVQFDIKEEETSYGVKNQVGCSPCIPPWYTWLFMILSILFAIILIIMAVQLGKKVNVIKS